MDSFAKIDCRLLLVSWFGCGFVRPAPGTVTSAVIVALYAAIWLTASRLGVEIEPPLQSVLLLTFSGAMFLAGGCVGPWSLRHFKAHPVARTVGKSAEEAAHDPSAFVLDEVAGQALALAFIPARSTIELLLCCTAAFVLFRVFDVMKPWPIRRFERLPGGWGICADDMVAGLFAGMAAWVVMYGWHWAIG